MAIDVNDLTIGQVKELSAIIGGGAEGAGDIQHGIGETVIVRTYSAGVWCGKLARKCGKEVVLEGARRMWLWCAAQGISLSSVAVHGIKRDKSRIAEPVDSVWLEAIEIIPVTASARESIMEADHAQAD